MVRKLLTEPPRRERWERGERWERRERWERAASRVQL